MLDRFGEFVTGQGALVGRLLGRLAEIGGVQRATILGAQAFTSLIPYLVIASALVPTARNESFADTLIENFDLEGDAADGVRALFASAGEVESAITFLGVGILLVTITSFARSLQSTYERAYGLAPSGLSGLPRGLLWIGALGIWLSLSSIRAEMQDWAGPVFSATVALGFAFGLWLVTPMILLGAAGRDTAARPGCGGLGGPHDRPAVGVGDLHADPDRERGAPLRPDRDRLLAAGLAARDRLRDRRRSGGRKRAERGHGGAGANPTGVRGSYGIVFVLVLLSFLVQASAPDGDLTRLVIIWLQGATLVFAVRIARADQRPIRLAAAVALLVGIAAPILWLVHGSIPDGVAAIATGLLVAVAPPVIAAGLVRDIRTDGQVTGETLSGVLSIYLLAGMFFSFAFAAVGVIGDEPFFAQVANPNRSDYLYFSYTTLTTTGFGDFTAATELGRTLAAVEALIGQIYLVTIVALIVTNLRPRRRAETKAPATPSGEDV